MNLLACIFIRKLILSLLLLTFMVCMVRWYVNSKVKNAWTQASAPITQNSTVLIVRAGMKVTRGRINENSGHVR